MSKRMIGCGAAVFLLTVVCLVGPAGAAELKVGDKAPDFTATDVDDKEVKFSSFLGKQVVLTFNRGNF